MEKDNRLGFAFFCPKGQEDSAREVLKEVTGVDLHPISQPVVRRSFVGNQFTEQKGVYIDGLCPPNTGVIIPCLLMENNISTDVNLWKRPILSELTELESSE